MKKDQQTGAVSIFVVIFTALLVTVITVGYVRTMMNDQQQASDDDLSQSAYDSAMAGVEDAKRVVAMARNGNATAASILANPANDTKCNAIASAIGGGASESLIQTSSAGTNNDKDLQQAYTCVKVKMNTTDVDGVAKADTASVVPLRSTATFNRVELQWMSERDLVSGTTFDVASLSADLPLRQQSTYSSSRPPVLTSQFIQPSGSFTLTSLDREANSAARTLSLYPHAVASESPAGVTPTTLSSADDGRTQSVQQPVKCMKNPTAVSGWGNYSCKVTIVLHAPVSANSSTAHLKLTSRYTSAHYKVKLFNNSIPVTFNGVQPEVDSTGRANNIFRRVQARIEGGAFAYPDAAVDVRNSLCKTFSITNNATDYRANSATCTP